MSNYTSVKSSLGHYGELVNENHPAWKLTLNDVSKKTGDFAADFLWEEIDRFVDIHVYEWVVDAWGIIS